MENVALRSYVIALIVGVAAVMPTPILTGVQFDVVSYGAVGDGAADDTGALQSAITAAAGSGGSVTVPAGTYRITKALTVPGNTRITGSGGIHQASAGAYGLRITGNDVTIEGLTLTGRHSAPTYAGGEYAIFGLGTATSPLRRVNVRNVTVSNWGAYGIRLQHVVSFNITDCNVFDIGYTGIGVLTASEGVIANNRVDNITPGVGLDKYGIAVTFSGNDLDSTDILVRGNTVSRVPWEALDTHGGKRITFANNTILASGAGIALNGLRTAAGHARVPQDITVTGNLIDGQADERVVGAYGVQLVGLADVRASATITGNTFRRSAETYFRHTDGVVISNNTFDRLNRVGVALVQNNSNFTVTDNTFIDVWSDTSFVAGIQTFAYPGAQSGLIKGNALRASKTKTARYLNQYGYYHSAGLTDITVEANNFQAATVKPIAGT